MGAAEALVSLGMWVALFGTSSLVALALVRRTGRVSRRQSHRVPARWVASPTPSAILHRRLRRAIRSLRHEVAPPRRRTPPSRLHELASEIEDLAASVDRSLIGLGFLPTRSRVEHWRRALVATQEIEELVARLRAVSMEITGAAVPATEWTSHADRVSDSIHSFERAAADLREPEPGWTDAFFRDVPKRSN